MSSYDLKYGAAILNNTAIDYLNNRRAENPNAKILVEIPNTKFLSSNLLKRLDPSISIRIAGGYTADRVQARNNVKFKNGETGEYYTNAVIYTRNEAIKIVEAIETIEKGMHSDWNDLQKIIYIYEKLKSGIKYDPKYEVKSSYDIRTLRGFITRKTVCAGYAMMFKEVLDRQGITCHYVEGMAGRGGHAWNIIEINGKKYPVDLTWDSSAHRRGDFKSLKNFGQNTEEFRKKHIPNKFEPIQDYEHELSSLEPKVLEDMRRKANQEKDYKSTTFYITRKDGTKCLISQVGNANVNGINFYRYLYSEIDKEGTRTSPLILYSETNVAHFMDAKTYWDKETLQRECPPGYEDAIDNVLFSKENIEDSLKRGTLFIGSVIQKNDHGKKVAQSPKEIEKHEGKMKFFAQPFKQFRRSDGSKFVVIQIYQKPKELDNSKVMKYECFEIITEDGKETVKKNTIFTNQNIFKISDQDLADQFLSRKRIDRKTIESAGYMGIYNKNGKEEENDQIIEYSEHRTEIREDTKKELKPIPKFEELHSLANKYEIYIDPKDQVDFKPEYIKVKNIQTGQIENDPDIIENSIFANIWLGSAGIKWMYGENREGENYAFNDASKNIYDYMCTKLSKDITETGVVDTLGLFKNSEEASYKHTTQIITNLFKTKYQTDFINQYFKNRVYTDVKANTSAEPLYNLQYAHSLLQTSRSR